MTNDEYVGKLETIQDQSIVIDLTNNKVIKTILKKDSIKWFKAVDIAQTINIQDWKAQKIVIQ